MHAGLFSFTKMLSDQYIISYVDKYQTTFSPFVAAYFFISSVNAGITYYIQNICVAVNKVISPVSSSEL